MYHYSRVVFCAVLLCVLTQRTFSSTPNDPCHALGLAESYDVIVVGAGVGGSVAARRLAEFNGDLKVLLVERGSSESECPLCADLGNYIQTGFDPITGPLLPFVPQTHVIGNPIITAKEAAIQGGGTAWNTAVYSRPDISFWNHFPPNSGWTWSNLIPYFIKVENYTFPNGFYGPGNNFNYFTNLRGKSGPVTLTQGQASDENGLSGKFVDAVKHVFPNINAYKNNSMNNGFIAGFGVSPSEFTLKKGVRISSYSAYIDTYTGSNLRSIAHVRVNKVLFRQNTVKGVELQFTNTSIKGIKTACTVNAPSVVISAGVFGTPKLLKLSGVGPQSELSSLHIPVVSNQPEVGANLDDQFGVSFFPTASRTVTFPDSLFHQYGNAYFNVQDDPEGTNNLIIDFSSFAGLLGPNITTAALQAYVSYAESKGTVKLASSNPDDEPIVDPQYLSALSDKETLAVGVEKVVQVIKRLGLTYTDPCESPSNDCSTPLKLLDVYLSQPIAPTPGDHWAGTAAIGKVVNATTLAVFGVNGLYALDASVLPVAPGEIAEASVFAVAERGIELIIHDLLTRGL